MKILRVIAFNFASYEKLALDLNDQKGLILIEGPTGSGKSTLCDVIPWALFGRTAKDGSVDEVIPWHSNKQKTEVFILLENDNGALITITRSRSAKESDLYFEFIDANPIRGKDIKDTQKLLNEALGFDLNTYLAGAYYHEFSQTSQFFQASASVRRVICEQIVDLSFAKALKVKLKEVRDKNNKDRSALDAEVTKVKNELNFATNKQKEEAKLLSDSYHKNKEAEIETRKRKIAEYSIYASRLPKIQQELVTLQEQLKVYEKEVCEVCGGPRLIIATKATQGKIQELLGKEYRYKTSVRDMDNLQKEIDEIAARKAPEVSFLLDQIRILKETLIQLELLQEPYRDITSAHLMVDSVMEDYRANKINSAISQIESITNKFLIDHFEGELSVNFEVLTSDSVDCNIYKDGNLCVYTQLSKGQRQIIKLCFSLAVMQVVNNTNRINFKHLFFDEALDGLDLTLKRKAFKLLEYAAGEDKTIFVVEHSPEIKSLFNNSYSVELVDGRSALSEA